MKKNFRILHNDQIRRIIHCFLTGFQKRQHINASHSLSKRINGLIFFLLFIINLCGNRKHLFNIPVHGIKNLLFPSVFPKPLIHPSGKIIQIQLIKLIIQKPCRLKSIQLPGCFLVEISNAGKAVGAGFCPVKYTAVGTHLFQQIILLQKQKIFLKKIQLSLGIYIVNTGKKPGDTGIIFLITVTVPDSSLSVCHKFKGQNPILIRGQLPTKILIPGSIIPVWTDHALFLHSCKVFLVNPQLYHNLYVWIVLQKILLLNLIISADCSDRIQYCCFSRVVLPYQNQSILNVCNMKIFNRFKVADLKVSNLHSVRLPPGRV